MNGTPVPVAFLPKYLCPRDGIVLTYGDLDLTTGCTPATCPICGKQWTLNAIAGTADPQTGMRGTVSFALEEVA